MHDDHQRSDTKAGVEGFREYRYRRCGDAVAQRKDERRENRELKAGRKKKSRRSRAAVNPAVEPYWYATLFPV